MKNKVLVLAVIFLAAAASVLAVLWRQAANDDTDLERLAQACAAEACESFADFAETGDDSRYLNGVASFRAFQQAYHVLTEGTNKSVNYVFCSEVYGELLLSPETCREHIADIVAVMEILAKDVTDENGYLRMSDLRNLLRE